MESEGSVVISDARLVADDSLVEDDKVDESLLKQVINKDVMLSGGLPGSSHTISSVVKPLHQPSALTSSTMCLDIDSTLSDSAKLLPNENPNNHEILMSDMLTESKPILISSLEKSLSQGVSNGNNESLPHIIIGPNIIQMPNGLAGKLLSLPLPGHASSTGQLQNILPKSSTKMVTTGSASDVLAAVLPNSSAPVVVNNQQVESKAGILGGIGGNDLERLLAGLVNSGSSPIKVNLKDNSVVSNKDSSSQVFILGSPLNVVLPQATASTAIQTLALQQLAQQQLAQQQLVQQQLAQKLAQDQLAQQLALQKKKEEQLLVQQLQQQLAAALTGTAASGSATTRVVTQQQAAASTPGIVVIGPAQQQLLQQIISGSKPAANSSTQLQQSLTQQQQQQQLINALFAASRPKTEPAATTSPQQTSNHFVIVPDNMQQNSKNSDSKIDVLGMGIVQTLPAASQALRLNLGSGLPLLAGQQSNSAVVANAGVNVLNTTGISQISSNAATSSSSTEILISGGGAGTIVDGVNLDEMREFAKQFKLRRLSLGLTQTQVGQALSATEGPSYSQSAICRFEKLDITPKSAQKIKPVLERWMSLAEERYRSGVHTLSELIGLEPSKKRKRRTSFTPQALELLNEYFEHCSHPSGAEMTDLADKLDFDREVIRVWFCNKRQTLKNTVKRLKSSTPVSSPSSVVQLNS